MAVVENAPHPLDVRVGVLIRTRRKEIRLSQEALAKACGVSFQQIQKYEAGTNRISFSRLVEIARALHVPCAWFFEGVEEAEPDPKGARVMAEFFRSAEGQAIAQAATRLQPGVRRALADLARSLAQAPQAA
ncbi:MAG: helix-turn-helix domain-containing protein [Phenylobacterium sp.]|uniref:helix-turn-helix domain-containing protein n=1 Tax=Phenylobacterium sp. TaxID=1871053 RepID=UPI00273471EE|nr:helix-turn-helix domain-containing protein [Phenylobacterium sp.]MDP1642747.1 helix-turn-helix domain-containing protein [Phenylobacterium sp.]MDP3117205.1 helix-turn-helix domain-containing protein [Phenylobacterium sp.]